MTDSTDPERPHEYCYVLPGMRLVAGQYPGDLHPENGREKLRSLVEFGVDYFVDLTSPDDPLEPYKEELRVAAGERGIEYRSFPIPDMGITDPETMNRILDDLDSAADAGRMTYVHCWGGVGRTGTVIGCYLVRRGRTGDEALKEVQRLFDTTSQSIWHPEGSPQTKAQKRFVKHWAQFDSLRDEPDGERE
ncbi:MAG: serine/threonine protein phosphatase [Gemmatimonadales bacterium]